jgi:hypothetical protein
MKRISLFAVVGILCYLFVLPLSAVQAGASANPLSSRLGTKQAFHPRSEGKLRVTKFASPTALPAVKPGHGVRQTLPFRAPRTIKHAAAGPARAKKAPTVAGKRLTGQAKPGVKAAAAPAAAGFPKLVHGFNGISTKSSAAVNTGLVVTPPDQALCVGNDPTLPRDPTVVFEANNIELRETSPTGSTVYRDVSLTTWFNDATHTALGDVRCLYDSARHEFIFTQIREPGGHFTGTLFQSQDTVAFLGTFGYFEGYVSTNMTGTCFGDQPKSGFDANAMFISTDEYCGPGLTTYGGALVNVIGLTFPFYYEAIPVPSIGGLTALGLDPAIGTPGSTGYLVNSFAYATPAFTVAYTTINLLGLFSVNNTGTIDFGCTFCGYITGSIIGSESYAFPVAAKSTTTTTINPDDDRTSGPVTVTVGTGGTVNLWTAITTAILKPGGTPFTPTSFTDGAAWFEVNATKSAVTAQGYVAGATTLNLVYPAVAAVPNGIVGMTFSLTAPWLNPSPAFTNLGSPYLFLVAFGSGSQDTFAYRWGDYSFAQAAFGGGIWMATEYIPPTSTWLPTIPSNWGTYVWEEAA